MELDAMILIFFFLILSFKPAFSLFSLTLIKRLFSSSSYSSIRVVSSTCLRLFIFLLTILIPAFNSSNLAFQMMCPVYKLNKQGDNKQSFLTPFSILNQSVVPYRVLIFASWHAYRFLRRQVRWSGIPISLRVLHRCYGPYSIVNERESESEVTQSCWMLCDPIVCSLPGFFIHGIFPGKSTGVGCHFLL